MAKEAVEVSTIVTTRIVIDTLIALKVAPTGVVERHERGVDTAVEDGGEL